VRAALSVPDEFCADALHDRASRLAAFHPSLHAAAAFEALETVAAIPGMVGGMLIHLKCLRRIRDDGGRIKILLDEAENERMHLMTFINIAQPNWFERFLVIMAQGIFFFFYLILYICSPRIAHRFVGYLEEEAVISYTQYLEEVESGKIPNDPAPEIAKKYWKLGPKARLSDLIKAVRADECNHRDVNHKLSKNS
jgi:ubiquinol oxidase